MERKKTSFCPISILIFHRCIREKWKKIDAIRRLLVNSLMIKKREQ